MNHRWGEKGWQKVKNASQVAFRKGSRIDDRNKYSETLRHDHKTAHHIL